MSDYQIFEAGDVVLQSGLTYRGARPVYKTHGTLNAAKSNVIVYPTSYGAQHPDLEWPIAAGRPLDPTRYFIAVINKFGNGLSSSPSNTPPASMSGTCTRTRPRTRDDRPGLKACLGFLHSGDVLVVWKLDRLGRSLSHLIRIVEALKAKGIAFCALTEQMDTTIPHGEFLFNIFGSLAQYERALIKERIMAGLATARRRARKGGRPPALDPERIEQVIAALGDGASKASVCRTFKVPRSTLIDTLDRIGWTRTGASAQKPELPHPKNGRIDWRNLLVTAESIF